MKNHLKLILVLVCVYFEQFNAQTFIFPDAIKKTMIANLSNNDSIVIYQCHVEEVEQTLNTQAGQSLQTAAQKYSITEKFVVKKISDTYMVKQFVSSLILLPNRRFSGLKIREKKYWNFKLQKDTVLTEKGLKILGAIELKGKEPTEYDFAITKYNTNQIIIKKRKDFKQLVIDGTYVLSQLIY
jgi:hypothetical protein